MIELHGFREERDERIDELNVRARIFRHVKTGAELLSMENDDENKVFGVSFRTPPPDSTGIAHILEHAVLGGSHKYPLKEPFVQLIKGSLKTFLNAFTSPDKTTYPVASTNLQDFYNLVDVYLDAVFHPLITRHHLEQEGWHYELENADDELRYKGVVFNEMKGVYSSPDSLLYRYTQQALFPDTIYGLDSGGDPRVIPELTYEQFTNFHRTYYHPSNARIFFYGDDPVDERLRKLDEVLGAYDMLAVNGEIVLQPPFAEPRRIEQRYGVDDEADPTRKSMATLAWALPELTDALDEMALSVLSYALIGTQASPLRKALIDSGLGEDAFGGAGSGLRQPTFRVVMKGMNTGQAQAFEDLTLSTLVELADAGIEEDMIEAAVNSIEFSLRENNTGSYPRGLVLFMRALSTWLYDRDPLAPLAFAAPLAQLKAVLAEDPAYLSALIRRYLLENPHRITLSLAPDPTVNQALEAEEKERLAAVRASLTVEELDALVANTTELRARQQAPDAPETLALLPSLQRTDLELTIKTIPLDEVDVAGVTTLYHDLFTNGIVYLDLGFDMHVLPQELLPYSVFFGKALTRLGTEREDYVRLSRRIGSKTGGIYATDTVFTPASGEGSVARFMVRGKSTLAQTADLFAILQEMLLTVKLDNRERFRQVVLETKTRLEASLIPSGHSWVNGRLQGRFSQAGWINEMTGGLDYLTFVRDLATAVDEDWAGVLAKLEQVRRLLIDRNALLANVTVDEAGWVQVEPQLASFVRALPIGSAEPAGWSTPPAAANEGLAIPAQVNYVGKGGSLYDLGYRYHGSINVITNLVRTSWLWDKIRAQGGAYGAYCRFSKNSGVWTYLSYRDPNLLGTIDVYDGTAGFLRGYDLSEDELTKGVIGAIGALDGYMLPDAKGYTSMTHWLSGLSDDARQQQRDEVLSTTVAHVREFADVLAALEAHGEVVVMGSADALAKANDERNEIGLQINKVM